MCGLAALLARAADAQETRYIYDALGQLIGVVDAEGRTVVYEYDEAGNLLAVRRPDTGGTVAITLVNPEVGTAGTPVEIFGFGFSETAGQNALAFAGVAAPVLAASRTRLATVVPVGAVSGPISVTTPSGSAVSPEPFLVPSLTISPTAARVALGRSRQFRAEITEAVDTRAAWLVQGIEGGNATYGTITLDGLYTAPAELPIPQTVHIRAESVAYPSLFAEATVEVLLPPPTGVVAAPIDIRVVRPGIGDPGGLSVNLTVAAPALIRVVRPGLGDPGGLDPNLTVAAPPLVSVVRPGTGDPGGLEVNLTLGAPPLISVVRPGTGDPGGLELNLTVGAPPSISAVRPGIGDPGGLVPNTTVAAPPSIAVVRPGTGDPDGLATGVTVAQPPDVRVRRE